jgi:hypothetical protein
LIEVEAEDACGGSLREKRGINIKNNKDNKEEDTIILLKIQGDDLRRFYKNKKRLH